MFLFRWRLPLSVHGEPPDPPNGPSSIVCPGIGDVVVVDTAVVVVVAAVVVAVVVVVVVVVVVFVDSYTFILHCPPQISPASPVQWSLHSLGGALKDREGQVLPQKQ